MANQDPEPTVTTTSETIRSSHRVTGLAVGFELALALLAAAGSWAFGYQLGAAARPTAIGTAVGVLATMPLLGGLWLTARSNWAAMRRLREEIERHVLPLFVDCSPLQLAAVAAAAGVGEELFFRGLVQGMVTDVIGATTGLLVASALFGLAHFITRTYVLLAALVGLYLGGLALWMDSLWAPIVVHSLYDFIALMILTRSGRPPDSEAPRSPLGLDDQVWPASFEGSGGESMRSTTASKSGDRRKGSKNGDTRSSSIPSCAAYASHPSITHTPAGKSPLALRRGGARAPQGPKPQRKRESRDGRNRGRAGG